MDSEQGTEHFDSTSNAPEAENYKRSRLPSDTAVQETIDRPPDLPEMSTTLLANQANDPVSISSMIRQLIQQSVRIIPWRVRTAIKRIPLVAPLQRRLLTWFLEHYEFIHEVDAGPAQGLVYPVMLPEDKGVWTGTYELEFVNALAASVKAGNVCLDVGGWRGYCGGVMAKQGAATVVIFEPLPSNCARIQKLIELNPSLPIRLVQAAAGEADGDSAFTVMDASSMGKLSNSPFQLNVASQESIPVKVVTLDNWCTNNRLTNLDVVKIDVEGAEMMVLHGSKAILAESSPTLFIEAHSRELTRQVVNYLELLKYEIRTLETGRLPDGVSEPEVCHLVAEPVHAQE